jgi:putative acetyltransferase
LTLNRTIAHEVSSVIEIREERPADIAAVRDVNNRAFGQDLEGRIVDALRSNGAVVLSLVATLNDRVVGHILYSPVTIGDATGAGLGPMAVLPEHQREGIGGRLIDEGRRRLEAQSCPFVIVVGHDTYYPRFGFVRASVHRITCEWEVPDEAFMVQVLDKSTMAGVAGMARYRAEFSMST